MMWVLRLALFLPLAAASASLQDFLQTTTCDNYDVKLLHGLRPSPDEISLDTLDFIWQGLHKEASGTSCGDLWHLVKEAFDVETELSDADLEMRRIVLGGLARVPVEPLEDLGDNRKDDVEYLKGAAKGAVTKYKPDLVPTKDIKERLKGDPRPEEVLSYVQRVRPLDPEEAHRAAAEFVQKHPTRLDPLLLLATARDNAKANREEEEWQGKIIPTDCRNEEAHRSAVRLLPELARRDSRFCAVCESRLVDLGGALGPEANVPGGEEPCKYPSDRLLYSCYAACKSNQLANNWLGRVFKRIHSDWSQFHNALVDHDHWTHLLSNPETAVNIEQDRPARILPVESAALMLSNAKGDIQVQLDKAELVKVIQNTADTLNPLVHALILAQASVIYEGVGGACGDQHVKNFKLLKKLGYLGRRFRPHMDSHPTQLAKLSSCAVAEIKDMLLGPDVGTVSDPLSLPTGIARRALYEIFRNPGSSDEERIEAWRLLVSEKYLGPVPDGYTVNWIVGNRMERTVLRGLAGDAGKLEEIITALEEIEKVPPVERQSWRADFVNVWKGVLSSILADWISERVPKIDKGDRSFEVFKRMLIAKLADPAACPAAIEEAGSSPEQEALRAQFTKEAKDQQRPRGLFHVQRGFSPASQEQMLHRALEAVASSWPLGNDRLGMGTDIFLGVLQKLIQDRGGIGVFNLTMFAHQRFPQLLAEAQLGEMYGQAFAAVQNTRQVDILLRTVPKRHLLNAYKDLPEDSPAWIRLAAMANSGREAPADRVELCDSIAKYIAEHASQQKLSQGLAFLALNSFSSESEYLKALYEFAAAMKLETFGSDAEPCVIRDVILERIILMHKIRPSWPGRQPPTPDEAVKKALGTLLLERAAELDPAIAKDYVGYFAASPARARATEEQWRHAVRVCTANPSEAPALLTKLFNGMEKTHWATFKRIFSLAGIEPLAKLVENQPEFDKAAESLCEHLEPLATKERIQSDCNDPASDALTSYRIFHSLADAKRPKCIANLFEATQKTVVGCELAGSNDSPPESLDSPLERVQEYVGGRLCRHRPLIAAAMFAAQKSQDEQELPYMPHEKRIFALKQALASKAMPSPKLFEDQAKSFTIDTIAKQALTEENSTLLNRYVALKPAEAAQVRSAQMESTSFQAALHLLLTMGYENFETSSVLLSQWDPKDKTNSRAAAEELVKILNLVMGEASKDGAKKLAETAKTKPFIKYVEKKPDILRVCENVPLDSLLAAEGKEIHKTITSDCVARMKKELLPEVIGIPRIASNIGDILTYNQLEQLPASAMRFLTKKQMGSFGEHLRYDDPQNPCNILKAEGHARQLHSTGALYEASPECLQLAGRNWIIAFSPSANNPNKEANLASSSVALAPLLTKDNFDGIDMDLLRIAKLPVVFWQNLGTTVTSPGEHPCVTAPHGISAEFWQGITHECLVAPRPSGSSLLTLASAQQLAHIPASTWDALGEDILQIPLQRFAYLSKEKRSIIFETMNQVASKTRVAEIVAAFENLDRPYLGNELEEAEVSESTAASAA